MLKKVHIYVLKHPTTGEVRYVGLTRFPTKRLHNEINYPHTKHFKNWVTSLKIDGLKPVMEIIEESEEGAASDVERKWIAEMKSRGCRLLNFTDGGESGFKFSDEYRMASSARQKGQKRKPHSAEHCAAISRAHLGTNKPWVSRQARVLIQANIGRKMSDAGKDNLSELGKKIMVGDRLNKFIEGNKRRVRQSKFTCDQRSEIKRLLLEGYSLKVIADHYGASIGTIGDARRGKIWTKIDAAQCVFNPPPHKAVRLIRNENGQYERAA